MGIFQIFLCIALCYSKCSSFLSNYKNIKFKRSIRSDRFVLLVRPPMLVSTSFSLDKTLVPISRKSGEFLLSFTLIVIAVFIASVGRIWQQFEGSTMIDHFYSLRNNIMRVFNSIISFPHFTKIFKITDGSVSPSTSEWKTCRLRKQNRLNDAISLFRFQCDKSFSPMDLSLGQQGSFDVIGSKKDSPLLSQLEADDQVAFKKGKVVLRYVESGQQESDVTSSSDDNNSSPRPPAPVEVVVDGLSIICSGGQGVAATLQLLDRVLTDADSAVESIDVLWINERKEDFVLNELMEALEDLYPDRLFVARVVDRQLFDNDAIVNDKLTQAMVPFRRGRMAMVVASEAAQPKSLDMLESLGYPLATTVVVVPC